MKKVYVILIISLFYSCSYKQDDTSSKITDEEDVVTCTYSRFNGKLDTLEIYRKSARIEIRSYLTSLNAEEEEEYYDEEDTLRMDVVEPKKDIQTKMEKLEKYNEMIVLNQNQKDSLVHLMYGFKKETEISIADCYEPRHRIHFYDEEDKLIAYIEICFECNQMRGMVKHICDNQLNYYKNFFKWCGIKKGFRHE